MNNQTVRTAPNGNGYQVIERAWESGDRIVIVLPMKLKIEPGKTVSTGGAHPRARLASLPVSASLSLSYTHTHTPSLSLSVCVCVCVYVCVCVCVCICVCVYVCMCICPEKVSDIYCNNTACS